MLQIHGPVLTQCHSLDQVQAAIANGGYNALKVVTGWGSPEGWTRGAMTRVANMVEHVVVRTVAGDPSYADGRFGLPIPKNVLTEIGPWYTVRPDIWIELGNEPNRAGWSEAQCWTYRYYLALSIAECRHAFPRARLIAPAALLQPDTNPGRWLEICADIMRTCDAIGVHAYEFDAWLRSEQRHGSTGQLAQLRDLYARLFAGQQWLLTEYGIHDPGTPPDVKGRRYAAMLRRKASTPALPPQIIGALYYHLCFDGAVDPSYHIAPAGDAAYKKAWQ